MSLQQLGPTDVFVLEVLVAAASLLAILVLRGGRMLPAAPLGFIALGVLEPGLSFALFDPLLGWMVLDERLSLPIAAALGAGFFGPWPRRA